MYSESASDGNGNQSSNGHFDGSEIIGPYSETAEQPGLGSVRKALADFREEMAEDAKVRNSVSTTFREDFAALAEAVRNSLGIPDVETPRLPSVEGLARAWGTKGLVEYRAHWLTRQSTLYRELAAHPDGSSILVDHILELRGVGAPPLPELDAMAEATGNFDRAILAALALTAAWEFVLADAAFIEEVHRVWSRATDDLGIRADDGKPLPHPLAPVIEGWLLRPVDVDLNRREDRILPSRLAQVQPGDRRAPKLFSPAAHVALVNGKQQVLPGFEVEIEGPALPLVLYDLGEPNPHRGGGRSAPLALRLFVEAILGVPLEDRRRHQPVAMELTLRELRNRLYPGRRISTTQVNVAAKVAV